MERSRKRFYLVAILRYLGMDSPGKDTNGRHYPFSSLNFASRLGAARVPRLPDLGWHYHQRVDEMVGLAS